MDPLTLGLTITAIAATLLFGILQLIVQHKEGKLKFSKRWPFVVSLAQEAPPSKVARRGRKKKRRSRRRVLLPAGVVVVLVIGVLVMRSLLWEEAEAARRKPIAVMTFKNLTGEESLDYLSEAIPNLLITNLEQSKDLSVMTWERMHDVMKAMGKEDVKSIDEDLGFELCRLDGIEAIVVGSFTKAGDMFATDVKVLDVETKRLMKGTSSKGEGVASILKLQIDELSKDISQGVGTSERTRAATHLPVADVTTASMDAYNYFLRGRDDYDKFYFDDARRFLEKAVELDSTFAVAYLYLARTYSQLADVSASDRAYGKAKAFSEKATERERFYIEAATEKNPEERFAILKRIANDYPKEKRARYELGEYYRSKNLLSEAIREFNEALQLDPEYGIAINVLAYTYAEIGDFETAVEYFRRYASVSPGDANPFDSMGDMYWLMGRLDDAIAKYREALEVKPGFGSSWKLAYLYALKEDYPEAMKWVDEFIETAPSPGFRAQGYWLKGFYHYWLRDLDESVSQLDRSAEFAEIAGNRSLRAYADWMKGWVYCDMGKFELSRRYGRDSYRFFMENDSSSIPFLTAASHFYHGLVDLKEGQVDSAKSRLADMKFPRPEVDQYLESIVGFREHFLHGEVLLAQDSAEKAIALCEKITPPPIPSMSIVNMASYNIPFLRDVLARAYQQKGEVDKAIAEYERLITFDPDSDDRQLIHPKYHYRLAKLYEEKGLNTRAIEAYEKFMEIWKNADPGTAEVDGARMRLSRLKATS
jgi:tetratricopeptide (TPR) repeat protein